MIPLGAWQPDLTSVRAPSLRTASGCVPTIDGYEPFKGLSVITDALNSRCLGAASVRDLSAATHIYAGDTSKLYKMEAFSWTDYSRGSGYGPAGDSTRWRFATYGDRLLATNGIDEIQYIDMSTAATAFADLAGSPPTAQYVTSFGEFVVLGALSTSNLAIKWSGFGNSEGWTAGVNQSDEQEFPDGGRLTGLAALDVCYIFQEKAIRRMAYVGGAAIMDIQKISDGIGCIEPNSLVQWGRLFFFLAEDGFYMFDGASVTPIGIGGENQSAFDRWFRSTSSRAYWSSMSATVDPQKKIVCWAFSSTETSTTPDTILVYNWITGQASYVGISTQFIFSAASLGISIDDLASTNIDTMEVSFDDPSFLGGAYYFGGFNSDNKLCSFAGNNVAATWVTGDMALGAGRVSVSESMLISDCASGVTLSGSGSAVPDSGATLTTGVSPQVSGWGKLRMVNGRYIRLRAEIASGSDWSFASGIDYRVKNEGYR